MCKADLQYMHPSETLHGRASNVSAPRAHQKFFSSALEEMGCVDMHLQQPAVTTSRSGPRRGGVPIVYSLI